MRPKKASHFPWIPVTSSFVLLTIWSINEDLPNVPIIIGVVDFSLSVEAEVRVKLVSDGLTEVTRWMSAAKSEAANCAPGQSSAEIRMGEAFLSLTTGNVPEPDLKVTQVSCPIDKTPCSNARELRRRANPRAMTS